MSRRRRLLGIYADVGRTYKAWAPQLLILGLTMFTIDLVVMHSYALLASTMQRLFRDSGAVRKQNRFFGGVLMAVGTALFFVKRGGAAAT